MDAKTGEEEEEQKGLIVSDQGSTEWYYKYSANLANIEDPSKIKKYKVQGFSL